MRNDLLYKRLTYASLFLYISNNASSTIIYIFIYLFILFTYLIQSIYLFHYIYLSYLLI